MESEKRPKGDSRPVVPPPPASTQHDVVAPPKIPIAPAPVAAGAGAYTGDSAPAPPPPQASPQRRARSSSATSASSSKLVVVASAGKKGEPKKMGKWTVAEKELLQQNIRRYAQEVGSEPYECMTSKQARDKTFWARAGAGLNRPFLPVYKQAHRLFDPGAKKGAYTSEEDQRLMRLHAEYGTNWKKISSLMGRNDQSCRDRWRGLEYAGHANKGRWEQSEVDRLIEVVHLVTKTPRGSRVDKDVSWRAVAKEHGTRSEKQCRVMWYDRVNFQQAVEGMVSLWSSGELAAVIQSVINLCRTNGYTAVQDIQWREVAKSFPNRSPHELHQRFLAVWRKVANESKDFMSLLDDARLRAQSGKAPRTNGIGLIRQSVATGSDGGTGGGGGGGGGGRPPNSVYASSADQVASRYALPPRPPPNSSSMGGVVVIPPPPSSAQHPKTAPLPPPLPPPPAAVAAAAAAAAAASAAVDQSEHRRASKRARAD